MEVFLLGKGGKILLKKLENLGKSNKKVGKKL